MLVFRCFTVFILFYLVLIPNEGRAATAAEQVQKAYDAIEGMRAEFAQTLSHKESGAQEERTGVLYFKKPLLLRWENNKPAPELLIVAKDAIWNVFPDEEMAYKYAPDMALDARSLARVITGQARLDQDFDVEEEGDDGGLLALRLYPKEAVQSLVEALLWIDASSGLIKKVRIYDFYGNENEISFTKQQIDAPMKDSLFRYQPPKDFLVEDRSQDGAAAPEKPLFQ
ncbi:outer membrane lipoprotein carrier protein LolA [Desulfovibrio sp. OttesenSCG-928-F20]|nr:outer membrane lipoprotein carrier protein LolA [Desulfovibrio sp. OttesenSCG-928-F20]